jgi:hypothetical protein
MSGKEHSGGFDATDEVSHLNQFGIVQVGNLVYDFTDEHFAFLVYNVYTSLLL